MANAIERRAFTVDELRVSRDDAPSIRGHAAVFEVETDLGFFREKVAAGAFRRAIAEDDVRALFNHDESLILGRNRAGTLKLSEDEIGLAIDIIPPDTQMARDLLVSIERGDISQMSFGFRVRKEAWEDGSAGVLRTLLDVELFDVSPVTFPAYPTTDVALRSLEQYRKSQPRGLTTRSAAPIVRRLTQRMRETGL